MFISKILYSIVIKIKIINNVGTLIINRNYLNFSYYTAVILFLRGLIFISYMIKQVKKNELDFILEIEICLL